MREVVEARPEGREFDQDSVSGVKRSFYHVEDERQRQQVGQYH